MDKKLLFKLGIIVFLVVLAGWELYPPQETLKPGLDLAGGTSLIYDIDTHGLQGGERTGLAETTIKVLRQRIDPSNVMNLVWRPLGNTRIEIQMPSASPDTIAKRKAYQQALDQLQQENINLALIIRALDEPVDKRSDLFEQYARGSQERMEILNNLAIAYDKRQELRQRRDKLEQAMQKAADKVQNSGLSLTGLQDAVIEWVSGAGEVVEGAVREFVRTATGADPNDKPDGFDDKVVAAMSYAELRAEWVKVVNNLTDEEDGLNKKYQQARDALDRLNLGVGQITDILELRPDDPKRAELIEQMKTSFPDRVEKIEAVVQTFDAYRPNRGRLDDPEDLKRMLRGAGVLEFRILPRMNDENISSSVIEQYRSELAKRGPQQASDNQYVWLEIEEPTEWEVPGSIVEEFGGKYYVLASNNQDEKMLAGMGGKEWKLQRAWPGMDQQGRRAINFMLDMRGGTLFFELTGENKGRPLCIILDDMAISAPNIQSQIQQRGIITGQFSSVELDDMINKLNAGSLKSRLIEPPVSENTIGASIGEDNRDQGIKAGIIGLIAIAIFMFIYYTGSGLIADIALLLNILFVLAIMAFSNATFTLPGIAGVILTIGMSVDANVLIFERIREEKMQGSSLRIAIQNGYKRAFSTIFDANLTTFLTAAILFYVASEEIKGFAITLMLGIISSMFTALFVTRVFFDILLDLKILKDKLIMLRIIRKPSVNWMSMKPIFVTVSIILIVGGLFIFFTRDEQENSKYDIEFTGGTSAQIDLKEGAQMSREQVEQAIRTVGEQMDNPALAAAKVYSVGETGDEYEISTTETNKTLTPVKFSNPEKWSADKIESAIKKAEAQTRGSLRNLIVRQQQNQQGGYIIETSQLNRSTVRDILTAAFGDKAQIGETEPEEVVTQAIRQAFGDKLAVLISLEPEIEDVRKIDTELVEEYPELTEYLGGLRIITSIDSTISGKELKERFESLRFKPGFRDAARNPYRLFTPQYSPVKDDTQLSSFVFVSLPAAGQGVEISDEDWDRYVMLENQRVTAALEMETSLQRITQIDPSIGQQAQIQALIAIILALIVIVGYIWVRFGTARYGFAAIAALVHDVCITLGAVVGCTYLAGTPVGQALGIGDFKIDLAIIAAFLTIIGYSLNDTIVVFDRIRENRGKMAAPTPEIINSSINQTLSRTLLTSLTTFAVVLTMYIMGGSGLRGFTFALLIGIVVGTYSSIAIAAPILVLGQKRQSKK